MSIEEQIEEIKKISIEEINLKIFEREAKINDAARRAMNDIYWILKFAADTSKIKVKKIEKITEDFRSQDSEGFSLYIKKMRKEQYEKDPEAFKKHLIHIHELSEKYKKEDEEDNK